MLQNDCHRKGKGNHEKDLDLRNEWKGDAQKVGVANQLSYAIIYDMYLKL